MKRAAYLEVVTSHGFLLLSPWWDTQPHMYTVYLDPVISLDALVKYIKYINIPLSKVSATM